MPTYSESVAAALCAQQQADMDGVMCIVSRQAADEGAALIRRLATDMGALRAERDAYRATLMDIAAVKHPDQQRTPHQEMARECVQKWETGK